MKISDIKATTVTVSLEAPLRHAARARWGRFVRTIVEVETDERITGLGGGGESAKAAVRGLKTHFVGHDTMQQEALYWKNCSPTASFYNNRNRCVWRLDPGSGALSAFARGAGGGDQFKIPNYASFVRDGTLYVSDSGTFLQVDGRILRFDAGAICMCHDMPPSASIVSCPIVK